MPDEVYVIDGDEITGLYDDSLVGLGALKTERASVIEPDKRGLWHVKLSKSRLNGKFAGRNIGPCFLTRAAALAFERTWINANILDRIGANT